eukprot:7265085-Pyramimonas_sp.AAC.1
MLYAAQLGSPEQSAILLTVTPIGYMYHNKAYADMLGGPTIELNMCSRATRARPGWLPGRARIQ